VDIFKANMATCAVFLGKIDEAKALYVSLLEGMPNHRKNHYQLSRLQKAEDRAHIDQMKGIIRSQNDTPERAIPLNFAIGKELEDLEQWNEAFTHYKKACDAVTSITKHDVKLDISLIDTIIKTCDRRWLESGEADTVARDNQKTPLFIVGLPRTGTTLTERILSSHSQIASLGETLFLPMAIRKTSGVNSPAHMTPEMVEAAAEEDIANIAKTYLESVDYRLGEEPIFIDKLPFNFLFAGFIARAWPEARIVSVTRNPMDTCFSMYKQPFTWAYKYSYSLDDLGRYCIAHDRLRKHWRDTLGEHLIEVEYEALVADVESQTKRLLDRLGLEYEPACVEFDRNPAPSTTASSVQVRSRAHSKSVHRWRRFEQQLQPLREHLEKAGIEVE
jgi:hypothetical protein